MKKLILVLLAVLVWLQYTLWLGKNGLKDYAHLMKEVKKNEMHNATLRARNERLFAEIDDLNSGFEAIEARARHDLGMIKSGESFYRLIYDEDTSHRLKKMKRENKIK